MAYNSNNYQQSAQNNLNFYQSSYSVQPPVSGHSTPFQAAYGAGGSSSGSAGAQYGGGSSSFGGGAAAAGAGNYGFGAGAFPGASGQMGTGQSGLRTGWLAAFGTEGYEGEPPLLEELGVNFDHIRMKVCLRLGTGGE